MTDRRDLVTFFRSRAERCPQCTPGLAIYRLYEAGTCVRSSDQDRNSANGPTAMRQLIRKHPGQLRIPFNPSRRSGLSQGGWPITSSSSETVGGIVSGAPWRSPLKPKETCKVWNFTLMFMEDSSSEVVIVYSCSDRLTAWG